MSDRSHSRPVVVVNYFTVTGDLLEFERLFDEYAQFMRHRPDFDFLVTVKLTDRPHVYAHLGHWRTRRGFLDTVNDAEFQDRVGRLGPLVETEADQAVSVARVLRENAVVGAANVVLTRATVHGDPAVFEACFAEANEHFDELGHFGGSDLLRSTLRPGEYTALQWWRDSEACERSLGSEKYLKLRAAIAEEAEVAVVRTRHMAYQRVIV
ncbi:antibiotic biosynthesis monooxygenase [Streptomyces sp. NPDC018610]|uniref:antibiotic biosynthesis monooxygenase n=1 Tax=Streptomyces sp. NPDC018610 TaxID=3365049 RepID=UPI0037BBCB11